jgi:salicylate hydroxylase
MSIAIIGGGLANALLKHPQLDVNIFYSAPKSSERGAAVDINMNAKAALAELAV